VSRKTRRWFYGNDSMSQDTINKALPAEISGSGGRKTKQSHGSRRIMGRSF
jgi:hypothetical protein